MLKNGKKERIILSEILYEEVVLGMGDVTVKFLGGNYQVSEAVNEFLYYDGLLVSILGKIIEEVSSNLARDSRRKPSDAYYCMDKDAEKYKKIITSGAELLVKKMLSLGIYDVTVNDLMNNVATFSDIDALVLAIAKKLVAEGEQFVEMKNRGTERAYRYASNGITGSGISIFTNSFSALMVYSLTERSILLSQAKKADKQYQEAVKAISARVDSGFERMCKDIMFGEYYPALIDILKDFPTKLMGNFFEEMISHGKFDFDSIEKYNMRKADEMLENIHQVSDKKEFLKQAFLVCPFSDKLYEKCLECNVLDKETFETASYFGMGDDLAQKVDDYIKKNLKEIEVITPLIKILALYNNCSEKDVLEKAYEKTLKNIKGQYRKFNNSLSDKRALDKFVRENLICEMKEIINKSSDDAINCIKKKMNQTITEKQFNELTNLGILLPEEIRIQESSSVELADINKEICDKLVENILEYIEEAKRRWNNYITAKKVFDEVMDKKDGELNALKSERKQTGLFAFSKKKEIDKKIDEKLDEIIKYGDTQNPDKSLLRDFENMYQ